MIGDIGAVILCIGLAMEVIGALLMLIELLLW